MNLADRYCQKCMNYEVCQATGCADRKELEELLSKTQAEPRLSKEEYEVLKGASDRYKYIARNRDGSLVIYTEPYFVKNYTDEEIHGSDWVLETSRANIRDSRLFRCIQWEDEEPTSIEVLLAEYENAMKLKKGE